MFGTIRGRTWQLYVLALDKEHLLKALEIENELREVVGRLITEVDLSTRQGRHDINLVSEDAWIPVLREVFQCPNLTNLNRKQKNFPGIDLGDEQDRVAFQVTASTDLRKIKKTLSQFRERSYKNSFDELYIFTITKKQSSYSQEAIEKEIQGDFSFCAKKNVIDPGDILERITALRLGAQERLLNEFRIILGDVKDRIAVLERADESLTLVSNLLKIRYPKFIFVAELDLDEPAIIQMAKDRLNYKKSKASKTTLVRLMLVMHSNYRHGWVVHENKILSFFDLRQYSDFDSVIDAGSVEKIESEYFFDNNSAEYRNLFPWLLKNTTKDIVEREKVNYHKEEKVFYFMPKDESKAKRQEVWVGQKKSIRTVYELKYQKKDPSKIAHHKHLSFDLSFLNCANEFYAAIDPSWLYTFNLYKKSLFHQDLLSNQKRLEYNQSVRNHILFLTYFLSNLSSNDVGLQFLDLVSLDCVDTTSINQENYKATQEENMGQEDSDEG